MNYIVLYADEHDCDSWEQYCDICGVSHNATYIKIKFNGVDVEADGWEEEMLEERLNEWVKKVVIASKLDGTNNTYAMMVDVDKILSEEFDRDPVFRENE